jgi:hypothetical protein
MSQLKIRLYAPLVIAKCSVLVWAMKTFAGRSWHPFNLSIGFGLFPVKGHLPLLVELIG